MEKRYTNNELIRLQTKERDLINKINSLSDEHDEVVEAIERELSLLPKELKQLDSKGNFILADLSDRF